jgi:Arc/MetJ family transcription regulator
MFDLDENLVEKVIKVAHVSTKKAADEIALKEFLRIHRCKQPNELIGNYNPFALGVENLERRRSESWRYSHWYFPMDCQFQNSGDSLLKASIKQSVQKMKM